MRGECLLSPQPRLNLHYWTGEYGHSVGLRWEQKIASGLIGPAERPFPTAREKHSVTPLYSVTL